MNEFVLFQRKTSPESLVANVALEGFYFCVCFLMRFEIADLTEGTAANVALVWFLSLKNKKFKFFFGFFEFFWVKCEWVSRNSDYGYGFIEASY